MALLIVARRGIIPAGIILPAGMLAYAICGTGPLAYVAGWLAFPFLIVVSRTGNES